MLTAPKTSAGMVLTEIQKPANVHLRQNLPYPQHLIQNQFALWICAGMVLAEIQRTAPARLNRLVCAPKICAGIFQKEIQRTVLVHLLQNLLCAL